MANAPLTPEKVTKIEGMFVRGYSLDLISEWGVHQGWTREQAKAVVTERGWALDWSGRLQSRYRAQAAFDDLPERGDHLIGDADVERMLAVGVDHELPTIRQMAVKAQRAVDDLRRALVLQEQRDAEDAARQRLYEAERNASRRAVSAARHGTWGGYLTHKMNKTEVCVPCGAARDAYKARSVGQGQQNRSRVS